MKYKLMIIMFTLLLSSLVAQDFTFSEFVGEWQGQVTSESVYQWNGPMTLVVEEDGFYTDSSGIMMPSIYPNTQESDFDIATNRLHFKYLQTVYAGQYSYQHFFYELIYYDGNNIEMHYNFWDDPEPQPLVMTITLSRVGSMQYGSIEGSVYDLDSGMPLPNVSVNLVQNSVMTDMYGSYTIEMEVGFYDLTVNHLGFEEYMMNDIAIISNETNPVKIALQHLYNPPQALTYNFEGDIVNLSWENPEGINLSSYNIYRDEQLMDNVSYNSFSYNDLTAGSYTFYVTALYGSYESTPSKEINILIQKTTENNSDVITARTELYNNYPNPFNPSTTISFNLASSSEVTLSIYDIRGRKVRNLINRNLSAGNHSY